jgi:hypothetical protein
MLDIKQNKKGFNFDVKWLIPKNDDFSFLQG